MSDSVSNICCADRRLVRINLSEQTDMMDLLGADLPAAGGAAGQFAWADGPLLAALQAGAWVLLDELNLASARPTRVSVGSHRCWHAGAWALLDNRNLASASLASL